MTITNKKVIKKVLLTVNYKPKLEAMKRLCIYTKDIQMITGKSDRYCRTIMTSIRKINNKQKHQPISVFELANYLGLNPDEVMKMIK